VTATGDRRFLKTPWVPPSVEVSRKMMNNLLFDGGVARCCGGRSSDLDSLGAGVGLHFRLLWYYFLWFAMAVVVASPVLALAYYGSRLEAEEMDPMRFARLSIANIGDHGGSWENYTVTVPTSHITYSARQVSGIVTACDFVYVVLFFVLVLFLKGRIAAITERVETSVISARDYTVFVTGLPANVKEEEVAAHFNGLYNLRAPDWQYASSCAECFCNRKMARRKQFADRGAPAPHTALPLAGPADAATAPSGSAPPAGGWELLTTGDPAGGAPGNPPPPRNMRQRLDGGGAPASPPGDEDEGKWVADVSLAYANGSIINRYRALAGLFGRIREAKAQAQRFNTGSPYADSRKLERTLAALAKLEGKLAVINNKYSRTYNTAVVGAYVTFNNEESLARCTEDYRGSDTAFGCRRWQQPAPLKFKGETLAVRRAPDPSQIVWQNLETSWRTRTCLQTGVTIVLLLLLAASFFFIMLAQAYQVRFRSEVPNLGLCNSLLPAIAFNRSVTTTGALAPSPNNTLPADLTLVRDAHDATCAALGASRVYWSTTATAPPRLSSTNATSPCLNECFSDSVAAGSCTYDTVTPGRSITFARSDVVACYCTARLRAAVSTAGVFKGLRELVANDGKFCINSATDYLLYNALIIVASGIVVLINTVLGGALRYIAHLEGHADLDAVHRSIATKVFMAFFLNTACIVLIINAALPAAVSNVTLGSTRLFNGSYAGFDTRWHTTVGVSIVLTMALNSITVNFFTLYRGLCARPCLPRKATKYVSQEQLDAAFIPPEWPYPVRVAAIMNTFFTCLMYSSGHPLLLAVGAFSFIVGYWLDRWALTRLSRRPPRYDNAMAHFSVSAIPWAIFIHLLFAVWMYSDPTVLYSPTVGGKDAVTAVAVTATEVDDIVGGLALSSALRTTIGSTVITRLSRENTLPLLILLVVYVFVWFFTSTLGRALVAFVRYVLCCGQCERFITLVVGDRAIVKRHPPYAGPYESVLAAGKRYSLSDRDRKLGARFWRERHGQMVRVWLYALKDPRAQAADGKVFGERLLTWEVIRFQAIPDYHIESNPAYRPAVLAIQAARAAQSKSAGKTLPRVGTGLRGASSRALHGAASARDTRGGGAGGAGLRTGSGKPPVLSSSVPPVAGTSLPDGSFAFSNPMPAGRGAATATAATAAGPGAAAVTVEPAAGGEVGAARAPVESVMEYSTYETSGGYGGYGGYMDYGGGYGGAYDGSGGYDPNMMSAGGYYMQPDGMTMYMPYGADPYGGGGDPYGGGGGDPYGGGYMDPALAMIVGGYGGAAYGSTADNDPNAHAMPPLAPDSVVVGGMPSPAGTGMPEVPPGYGLPPPGYDPSTMPPPGYDPSTMPPPGYDPSTMPPPGYDPSTMPPPGYDPHVMAGYPPPSADAGAGPSHLDPATMYGQPVYMPYASDPSAAGGGGYYAPDGSGPYAHDPAAAAAAHAAYYGGAPPPPPPSS